MNAAGRALYGGAYINVRFLCVGNSARSIVTKRLVGHVLDAGALTDSISGILPTHVLVFVLAQLTPGFVASFFLGGLFGEDD